MLPSIASVDGDGLERAVAADLGDEGVSASHRLTASLRVRGTDLDQATAVELRDPEPTAQSPCLAGPGADPCVVHDASTGLLLQAGGDAAQQTVALPPTLATGLYLLALITPSGEAHAQVFFLQGEPGLHCWDRDENHECDLASEDVDGDGTCSTADCQPPTPLQCTGPDCVLSRNLLVAGDVESTGGVTAESLTYGEQAVGEAVDGLDSRVATLESATTAMDLAVLQAQVDGLELDLGAVDARLAAVEADFATATALADLDARVSVVELDYVTGTEVDAIDVRLSAVETTVPTDSALAALDARVTAVEADYATDTDLQALADLAATEIGASTTWTVPGDFATVEEAWEEVQQWRVRPGVTLTLEITGVHAVSNTLHLDHPDGHRIQIVGGSALAGADVLEFTGTAGLLLSRTPLRLLENLTIRGIGVNNQTGVTVTDGAHLSIGADVFIEDFHHGLRVTGPSGADAIDGVTVTGSLGSCLSALYGGTIYATNSTLDGCDIGLYAQNAATIVATNSTVQNASGRGIVASSTSAIEATSVTAVSASHCAHAINGSYIGLQTASCAVDTPAGTSDGRAVYAQHGSYIFAAGSAVLEAELGSALYASMSSNIVAWGGRTLRSDGTQLATAVTNSSIRMGSSIWEGAYTGGVHLSQQSFAIIDSVVDPNSVTHDVEAGSLLEQ